MPKNTFDASAPQLTIAVPAYNVESYLARGLESYLDPRFVGNLEVIVVDDGSTDGTRALAEEFAARSHGVIRVISKKNGGHGSAVNAGLAEARGRYFRVVDGDDWVNADGMAELLVSDCGPGFSPEIIARVFEPYVTTKARGTGLGLAIAKEIIRMHGATVRVQSKLGQGSSFIITFPADKVVHPDLGQ